MPPMLNPALSPPTDLMQTMGVPIIRTVEELKKFLSDVKNRKVKRDRRLGGSIAILYDVGREMAEVLLRRSAVNRKPRPHHVVNLSMAMEDKSFYPLVNTIKVDENGYLVDARHRLMAIVAADVVIPALCLVVLGRDEAKRYIDSDGAARSEGDVQAILGKKPIHGSIIGGLSLERNNFSYSIRESRRIRLFNSEASPHLEMLKRLYKMNTKVTAGVMAAVVRCARVDAAAAEKFFSAVLNRDNTKAEIDGAHVREMVELRNLLLSHQKTKLAGFPRLQADAERSIIAFKSWYNKEGNLRNKLPNNGAFPSFGLKEWEDQIESEIVAGKSRESKAARVAEICKMYK